MTSLFSALDGKRLWAVMLASGLALLAQPSRAQPGTPATIRLQPEDQERGQYGPQHNFYFLPPGKTGEDYQSAGFLGGKLRPYLAGHPQALRELARYQRQKTLFLADRVVLVGAVGLYASQVLSHGDPVYFNTAQQVAAGAAAVSLLATLFINRHTNEYLKQAVDTYNTDAPAQSGRGALWPRLRPTGLGVAAISRQPVLLLRWQL